jgi:hypothetical protein
MNAPDLSSSSVSNPPLHNYFRILDRLPCIGCLIEIYFMSVSASILSQNAQWRRRYLSMDSPSRIVDVTRVITRALGGSPWIALAGLHVLYAQKKLFY